MPGACRLSCPFAAVHPSAAVREKRAELDDYEAVIDYFVAYTGMAAVWSERKALAEERLNVRGVLAFLDEQ